MPGKSPAYEYDLQFRRGSFRAEKNRVARVAGEKKRLLDDR